MKKLLVVLSVVLVLAFAGSSFAATTGHVGHYTDAQLATKGASALAAGVSTAASADLARALTALGLGTNATVITASAGSADITAVNGGAGTNQTVACFIPRLSVSAPGTYVVRIALNINDLKKVDPFEGWDFKLLGVTGGTANVTEGQTHVMYLDATTLTEITANNFKTVMNDTAKMNDDTETYLIFVIGSVTNAVAASEVQAADVTFQPALYAAGKGGDNDPGSSGGGCVAGTSALALAVLGLFIAKGKK